MDKFPFKPNSEQLAKALFAAACTTLQEPGKLIMFAMIVVVFLYLDN